MRLLGLVQLGALLFAVATIQECAAVTRSDKSNVASVDRRWARYKPATRGKRGDIPPAAYSPINGGTIVKSIQQQIKSDVNAVLDQFKDLPDYVKSVLKTGLSKVLGQSNYKESTEDQYKAGQTAIETQVTAVQSSLPTILGKLESQNQQANLDVLKECITKIVKDGTQTADNGKCLSDSGFSKRDLIDQFNSFVDINQFVIPVGVANDARKQIVDYLNSVTLTPDTEKLIDAVSGSIQNVVASTTAKDRDASEAAFKCWVDAIYTISSTPIKDRQNMCDNYYSDTDGKKTTLEEIEERYLQITTQYGDILPIAIAKQIQLIGTATLSMNIGPYDKAVRDRINDAILSQVSAVGGQTSSLARDLIACLNTMYDDTPDEVCNPLKTRAVLVHNQQILANYLDQYVSILPKALVKDLKDIVNKELEGDQSPDAQALRKKLQDAFDQASLGTEYSTCEQTYIGCVVDTAVNGPGSTECHRGEACNGAFPPLGVPQDQAPDGTTPYNPGSQLGGSDNWGGSGGTGRKKLRQRQVKREGSHRHALL